MKEEKPQGRPKRVTRPPAWLTMEDEPARKEPAKAPRSRKRKVLPRIALLVPASRADLSAQSVLHSRSQWSAESAELDCCDTSGCHPLQTYPAHA